MGRQSIKSESMKIHSPNKNWGVFGFFSDFYSAWPLLWLMAKMAVDVDCRSKSSFDSCVCAIDCLSPTLCNAFVLETETWWWRVMGHSTALLAGIHSILPHYVIQQYCDQWCAGAALGLSQHPQLFLLLQRDDSWCNECISATESSSSSWWQ